MEPLYVFSEVYKVLKIILQVFPYQEYKVRIPYIESTYLKIPLEVGVGVGAEPLQLLLWCTRVLTSARVCVCT